MSPHIQENHQTHRAVTQTRPADIEPLVTVVAEAPHEAANASTLAAPEPPVEPTDCLASPRPLDNAQFPDAPRARSSQLPATISNVRHLLQGYGVEARYNVIKKKLQVTWPGQRGSTDNADNVARTHLISLAALNGLPVGQVPAYVEVLGDQNIFNPVSDWIGSRPWDGLDRLPAIYATLVAREGYPARLKEALIYRWLLSAVAAALKPSGFKARGVLTLQGPQGIGKTSWVTSLVPNEALREAVVKVDHHLDGNNKDSIIGAVTHWIVEIGELDSSFKKDIARLKGFLTTDQDKVRRPYAAADSEYARRTVFSATVNETNFLVDMTGNSRWWTIPVTSINFQHGIDMQQLFAQLAEAYGRGEQWWLTKDEEALLVEVNADHLAVSAIHEQILGVVDSSRKVDRAVPYRTSTWMLKAIGIERPTNAQSKECVASLRQLLGESKKVNGSQCWRVPLTVEARGRMDTDSLESADDDDDIPY